MREAVAIVPEGRRVFSRMTVEENLAMGGFFADRDQFQTRIKWVYEELTAEIGAAHRLVGQQRVAGVLQHHVAVLQHIAAVGQLQRLVGV